MLGIRSLWVGTNWWVRLVLWLIGALFGVSSYLGPCIDLDLGRGLAGRGLRRRLITLSFWILALIILGSGPFKGNFPFLVRLRFLLIFLVLRFRLDSFLGFYVRFEASLIPTLVLVLGWGYQPERVQAGVYIIFYTLLGSLPLLFLLLYIKEEGVSRIVRGVPLDEASWWFMAGALAFFIKLPMFRVHLWLPKAHVEAPAAGSIILAGVLLKLGGYGLICLACKFNLRGDLSTFVVRVGLIGGCLIGLVCLAQRDAKRLVAYSSVAHMRLCLAGALIFNIWGVNGTLTIILGHGLCSSGLFYLVNLVYLRTNSRRVLLRKGNVNFLPTIRLWWFLFCVSNMAAPPTLNLLGEIQIIIRLVRWEVWSGISLFCIALAGGAYRLFIFYRTQHGRVRESTGVYSPVLYTERLNLFFHWVPLNLIFLQRGVVVVRLI